MDEQPLRSDVLLVSVIAFVGASTTRIWPTSTLLALASAVGLVLWMAFRRVDEPLLTDDRSTSVLLLIPVIIAIVATAISPAVFAALIQNALAAAVLALVALVTARHRGRVRVIMLSLGLVALVVGSALWVSDATRGGVIDIALAHEEAADAFVRGENPYNAIQFENTSPYGDREPFIGYPYPPVSLIAYGATSIALPVGVVTTVFIVLLVLVLAWSGYPVGRFNSSFAMAVVVAGTPALGFMLFSAATEGFSSLLFLMSGVVWRRRPIVSAALLGLAIASKQYFIVPALALLLADVDRRWLRIGVGVAAAAVVTVPFLLWDSGSLIQMLGVRGSGWDFRPDAISIGALGVVLPTALVAIAAVVAMWSLRKKVTGPGSFFFVAATGLIVMLALHPHSFANHWFGLLVLIATGIVTVWRNPTRSASGSPEIAAM